MSVSVRWRGEVRELAAPLTVSEALAQLGLPPELYLVLRNGVLLQEDDLLQDGDAIRLVGVISGGAS